MRSLNRPKESGIVHIPILIAAIALLGFIFVSSSADFKNKLFARLYPNKPQSQATEGTGSTPTAYRIKVFNIKMEGGEYGAPSDKLEELIFTGQDSIKEFYEETSKPDITSPPKATMVNSGIHEISYPESALPAMNFGNTGSPSIPCEDNKFMAFVNEVARNNGVDMDSFLQDQNSYTIYIVNGSCSPAAPHAPYNSRAVIMGIDYTPTFGIIPDNEKTLAHELAHVITGVWHPTGLSCRGSSGSSPIPNTVMELSKCGSTGRGADRAELMDGWGGPYTSARGNSQLPSFSVPIRIKMGWLNPQKILEVTTSGTYTLNRLWSEGAGPEVLKIRRPNDTSGKVTSGDRGVYDYYISLRNTTGFEASVIHDDFKTGIGIHLADLSEPTRSLWSYAMVSKVRSNSQLSSGLYSGYVQQDGYFFGGLQQGETFTDTLGPGLRISHQLAVDNKSTNVTVTFGINNVQSPSPTPSPTPNPTPAPVVRPPYPCRVCRANVDRVGVVNMLDLGRLQACFNKKASQTDARGRSCANADVNGDGVITILDFSCLASKFNQSSPSQEANDPICRL